MAIPPGQFIHCRGIDGLHTSICSLCHRIVASQVLKEQIFELEEPHTCTIPSANSTPH